MFAIRSLSLKGFLSHVSTSIDFSNETYVILGSNGSGKTSILRGIFFGLFGRDIVFNRKGLDRLLNTQSNSMHVTIEFSFGNDEYRIERTKSLSSKGFDVRLFKNGKMHVRGLREVDRFMDDLGMDYNTFRNTVYVPQGELSAFLDGEPKTKRELLNRISGLERLTKRFSEITDFRKRLESQLSVYVEKLSWFNSALKDKQRLEDEIHNLLSDIEKTGVKLNETSNLLERQKSLLKSYEEKANRFEILSQRLKLLNSQRKKLISDVDDLRNRAKRLEGLKKQLPEMEAELARFPLVEKLYRALGELKRMTLEMDNLKLKVKEVSDKKQMLDKLSVEASGIKKDNDEIDAKLKVLENKEKQDAEHLKSLRQKKERFDLLSSCLREKLRDFEKVRAEVLRLSSIDVESLEAELKHEEETYSSLTSRLSKVEVDLSEERNKLSLLTGKDSRCPLCGTVLSGERIKDISRQVHENISKLLALKERLEDESRKTKDRIDDLRKKLSSLTKKVSILESRRSDLRSIELEIQHLKSEMKSLSFNSNELSELEEMVKRESEGILKLSERRKHNLKRLREIEVQVQDIESSIRFVDSNELSNRIEELTERKGEISGFIKEMNSEYGLNVSDMNAIEKAYSDLRKLNDRFNGIKGELGSLPNLRELIKKKQGELRSIDEEIRNTELLIDALSYDKADHQTIKSTFEELTESVNSLKSELSTLNGRLNAKQEELKRVQSQLSSRDAVYSDASNLKHVLDVVKLLEMGFHPSTGFVKSLREDLLPTLSHTCRELFEGFNFDFNNLSISEDLTVSFSVPNVGTIALDQLSGGQRMAFAIALRFAMAKQFMQGLDVIMLDEPTVHLDEERRRELSNILLSLKGKLKQMVIVTHDPELEIVGDKVLRLKKVNGVSSFV